MIHARVIKKSIFKICIKGMTEGNPSTESVDECNCTSDDDLTTEKLVKPKQMSSADWIKEVCCVLTRQIDMDLDLIKGMKTDIIGCRGIVLKLQGELLDMINNRASERSCPDYTKHSLEELQSYSVVLKKRCFLQLKFQANQKACSGCNRIRRWNQKPDSFWNKKR